MVVHVLRLQVSALHPKAWALSSPGMSASQQLSDGHA